MKILGKATFIALSFLGLWLLDFAPEAPFQPVLVDSAEAVVGRPLTPVSVGGVARRTTRRAVYASSASAASQQQAAASQQQAAPAPAPSNQLPAGTVVTALPAGCESMQVDGRSLFNCGGVVYEPKFQSNNLVYVVQ